MRVTLATLATAVAVFFATGCGGAGGGAGAAPLGAALDYVAEDAPVVVLATTDIESDRFTALADLLQKAGALPGNFKEQLEQQVREMGLDYEADVKPLLGNDVVVTAADREAIDRGGGLLVVLDTEDGDTARRTIEKAGGKSAESVGGLALYAVRDEFAAVDGDVVLVGGRETIEQAAARAAGGSHLTLAALASRTPAVRDGAVVRGYVDAEVLIPRAEILRRLSAVPWFAALRRVAFSVDSVDDRIGIDLSAVTDADSITEEDLPIAPGGETPEVLSGHDAEVVAASSNQSQTTFFLLQAVRRAFPNSRFVREVDAVERDLGIDFEQEVLRQFNGPSVSAVSPDGQVFAARSAVRDPQRLQALVKRLAPRLPALIEGLQGLRSQGMALLFLLAPDAPGTRTLSRVQVTPPAPGDFLYHVTGLEGDGPSEFYFGVTGTVFVVASDERRARAIVDEETEPNGVVDGASVFRIRAPALAATQMLVLPFDLESAEDIAGGIDATRERLHGALRIEP